MDNYNDINNEDNIIEQEQPGGGSLSNGIDPQIVADIAAKVSAARSQNYDHSRENKSSKKQDKKEEKNDEKSQKNISKENKENSINDLKKPQKQGFLQKYKEKKQEESLKKKAQKEILKKMLLNPTFLIICGGVLILFMLIIFVVIFGATGSGLSIGGGAAEEILIGACDEGDTKCEEIYDKLQNEYASLGSADLYKELLLYCEESLTLGQKFQNILEKLYQGDENIQSSCDLMRVVESYVKKKEQTYGITLSRGLIVGTLQWLYNSKSDIENETIEEKTDDSDLVNTAHPNKIISNIVSSGLVTAKDIRTLVEYMVYEENYTYYNWEIINPGSEFDCEFNPETNQFDKNCKTKITYGCKAINYKNVVASPQKYFMFLRYGGVSYDETISGITKRLWYSPTVTDGYITQAKYGGTQEPDIYDPATSFQEITSYNIAFNSTPDECKIEGKAQETIDNLNLNSSKNVIYEKADNMEGDVDDAVNAFPKKDVIDTTGYQAISNEDKSEVVVLGSNCRLNNIKSDSVICPIEIKEISYYEGFINKTFPQYNLTSSDNVAPTEKDKEKYKYLSGAVETKIEIIDEYEDYLNEIFGFYTTNLGDIDYYQGISTSSSCIYQNKPVRLHTPDPKTYELPGGSSYVNGTYVANETITLDEYVKSATLGELRGLITQNNIEAVKFMMIAIKSYALRNGDEKNGELYYKADSHSFQSYRPLSNATSEQRSVLDSAYSAVKDILLYEKGTEKVFNALYGSEFQNRLVNYAQEGKKYTDMLSLDGISDYAKVHYSGAEFKNCSTTLSSGGTYNGNVDTKWPFFPAGTNYSVSSHSMFICRKMDSGRADFHAAVDLPVAAGTQITCPIDGVVISRNYWDCGNGVIKVQGTIPGTSESVVLQFTHLSDNGLISNGSVVKANQTVIGYTSDGRNDECSSGSHLDFKAYNAATKRYYNPSVFVAGILAGSTNIPMSSYIVDYNGGSGPDGYDKCCEGRIGNLPQC